MKSGRHRGDLSGLLPPVVCLSFCGRDIAQGFHQSVVVVPSHPFQGRQLDGFLGRWIQPVDATPSITEVFMGRSAGWMQNLTGRGAMCSPGAPSLRREVERQFWTQIATGMTSEKAAEAVGVSQAVGSRWFRHRGGMPLFMSKPVSGRYLSFAEREEIGLLRAQDVGVREIARRIGRSPPYRLTGVDTQCSDPRWQARISGVSGAVEVRAVRQKAQAGQAGEEPASAPIRPRPSGRQDP